MFGIEVQGPGEITDGASRMSGEKAHDARLAVASGKVNADKLTAHPPTLSLWRSGMGQQVGA